MTKRNKIIAIIFLISFAGALPAMITAGTTDEMLSLFDYVSFFSGLLISTTIGDTYL